MKLILNLGPNLNVERYLSYALVLIFALLCFNSDNVRTAFGADSKDEPRISLKVQNQPLGDVLKQISLDTGYKFKLNNQWSRQPVNASFENAPIDQGLKQILRGLNHAIIYESGKNLKILIYGMADSRKIDSSPVQSFSSQDYQRELPPSPEPSPEEADESELTDDSSEKAVSSESTEEKGAESEGSSGIKKKESSEETEASAGKELDQGSTAQSENVNEQNEQKNAVEEAPSENAQKQN